MTPDYLQLAILIVGVWVLSVFGFYAVRLLASFKKGMLEKGWKLVTYGAIVLVLAQIPFLIGAFSPAARSSLLSDMGDLFRLLGMLFLIFGFREQYQVWRVDEKEVSPNPESNKEIRR